MGNELNGRIALVTGASRGIGRAIAVALAGTGADVCVNYLSNECAAQDVCVQIRGMGRRALPVQGNVARASEVARMVELTRRELGPITVLVNSAGIGMVRTIRDVTEEDWDEILAVNLKASFLVTQTVLPDMRAAGFGRIIGISPADAQIGGVAGPQYAASKGGIVELMQYYAAHLAKEGISANAIVPRPISTDMGAALPRLRPDLMLVARFGIPEMVAETAAMLARNGNVNGQTLNVNGGRYLD